VVHNVSDARSNPSDQIAHAAKVIGRSKDRTAVFKAIYEGKKRVKSAKEIEKVTHLSRIRVLQEGGKLAANQVVHRTRKDGMTAYEKDSFFGAQKAKILSLAQNRKKLAEFPTKSTPRPLASTFITIRIPRQRIKAKMVTIDDIDSFSKVRRQQPMNSKSTPLFESKFKQGIKRILGEQGKFTDWGGERNDLLSTRVCLDGKRRATAFAFKGKGQRGKLTPARMGKNGDQIQRLFSSPAEIFLVQYWDQIDESVIQQMAEFAKAKSAAEGKPVFYGTIDGQDSNRLIRAYPKAF
jgi:hypothetical protein